MKSLLTMTTVSRIALPLLLLTLTLPFSTACNRSLEVKGPYLFRQYSLSTSAPTAAALLERPDLQQRIQPLQKVMSKLFEIVDRRITKNNSRACNLAKGDWVRTGFESASARQIGAYENICDSRIDGNEAVTSEELSEHFVTSARAVIRDAKEALFTAVSGISAIPDMTNDSFNWTFGPVPLRDWDLRRLSQQCTVESAFAYRVNGTMYLSAAATNRPVNAFEEDFRRQYVQEFIAEDFKSSLPFCHPQYDGTIKSNLTEVENVTSTTLLTTHGGKATLASHGEMDFDENPAILEAMRLNEIAVDQAQDAITGSNIAILALPMAMSLIPVAFLADLNTCATLWYIIFTDIFSALPFLIKGIELVQSAEVSRGELVAYHIGNATTGELEVWAAECSGDDSFRILGIVFVAIAGFAIVFGVLLELIAGMIMRRRRKNIGRDAEGPFGRAAFDTTAYSLLGSAKDDEKERRYSMEGEHYALDESMAEKGLFLRFRRRREAERRERRERREGERRERREGERSENGSGSKRNSKESVEVANAPGLGNDGLTGAERAEISENPESGSSSQRGSDTGSFGAGTSLVPPANERQG